MLAKSLQFRVQDAIWVGIDEASWSDMALPAPSSQISSVLAFWLHSRPRGARAALYFLLVHMYAIFLYNESIFSTSSIIQIAASNRGNIVWGAGLGKQGGSHIQSPLWQMGLSPTHVLFCLLSPPSVHFKKSLECEKATGMFL